jgi:hypothetical protein
MLAANQQANAFIVVAEVPTYLRYSYELDELMERILELSL